MVNYYPSYSLLIISRSGTPKGSRIPSGPVVVDENTIYLEDVMNPSAHKTPANKSNGRAQDTPPSSSKKARWRDHDPYRLPEVNMDEVVAKATGSIAHTVKTSSGAGRNRTTTPKMLQVEYKRPSITSPLRACLLNIRMVPRN